MNSILSVDEQLDSAVRLMRSLYDGVRSWRVQDAAQPVSNLYDVTDVGEKSQSNQSVPLDLLTEVLIIGHPNRGRAFELLQIEDPGMTLEDALLEQYGLPGFYISEERGTSGVKRFTEETPIVISDPLDRSKYAQRIIDHAWRDGRKTESIGTIFDECAAEMGARAMHEGFSSSFSVIKDRQIAYSTILNLLNGDIYVTSSNGAFRGNIKDATKASDVNNPLVFGDHSAFPLSNAMVCYTGTSKTVYKAHIQNTSLRSFNPDVRYLEPGGPLRFTHLLEDAVSPVGVVGYAGDKLQESLPGIVIAAHHDALIAIQAHPINKDHFYTRNGVPLAPGKDSFYAPRDFNYDALRVENPSILRDSVFFHTQGPDVHGYNGDQRLW